jgi:hypothetical protein
MKFSELTKKNYRDVKIDGVKVKFQILSWKDLKEVQKVEREILAGQPEKEFEDDTGNLTNKYIEDFNQWQQDRIYKLSEYLLDNYILDEDGDKPIAKEQVVNIPFEWCAKCVNEFLTPSQNEDEDDPKKK